MQHAGALPCPTTSIGGPLTPSSVKLCLIRESRTRVEVRIMDLSHSRWRKSSYSSGTGGACVEVAPATDAVGVRDTKDRTRGHFAVDHTVWQV